MGLGLVENGLERQPKGMEETRHNAGGEEEWERPLKLMKQDMDM